ncbi:hypothetical protein BY996DRAFT_6444244 [Phakopsora pachyrhizi]|nr:hypothetical protein BY996DRAFT_6444244 [Phakopsora pachyrhizi]
MVEEDRREEIMEARKLSLNTSLIDETLNQTIGGKKQSDGTSLKLTSSLETHFEEESSLQGQNRSEEEVEMKLMTKELRFEIRELKVDSKREQDKDQGGAKALRSSNSKEHCPIVQPDCLSNSSVEDDHMTASQRIGYHYLPNLKFGSTVDVAGGFVEKSCPSETNCSIYGVNDQDGEEGEGIQGRIYSQQCSPIHEGDRGDSETNEGITVQEYEKTEQMELGLSQSRQQSPLLMMRDKMNKLNGQIESLRISSKRSTLEQEELKKKNIDELILENEDTELRGDLKKFIDWKGQNPRALMGEFWRGMEYGQIGSVSGLEHNCKNALGAELILEVYEGHGAARTPHMRMRVMEEDKRTEEQRIEDREDIGLQEKEAEKIVDIGVKKSPIKAWSFHFIN